MNVLIAGDFFPGGRLAELEPAEPERVFGEFCDTIRAADLAALNLEAPLCDPHQPIEKTGPTLCAKPESAAFMAGAGFQLATLANNHIFDFGAQGLKSTFATLDRHGVAYVGAGASLELAARPFVFEKDCVVLAILNFAENEWSTTRGDAPGANPIDPVANFHAIRDARRQADHVIVVCHGGHEMYNLPSPRMKALFRFYVDAGASAVVNHHTHCSSGHEVYHGAPIFYSLGNFLFDNPRMRTGPWTQGIAIELQLSGNAVDYRVHFFDQCREAELFRFCDEITRDLRSRDIASLNEIIGDDELLAQSFRDYSARQTQRYLRYLEPVRSRFLLAAQNRGLAPSLLSNRQRRLLLNLIRCEAHRDMIVEILDRDVGDSQ